MGSGVYLGWLGQPPSPEITGCAPQLGQPPTPEGVGDGDGLRPLTGTATNIWGDRLCPPASPFVHGGVAWPAAPAPPRPGRFPFIMGETRIDPARSMPALPPPPRPRSCPHPSGASLVPRGSTGMWGRRGPWGPTGSRRSLDPVTTRSSGPSTNGKTQLRRLALGGPSLGDPGVREGPCPCPLLLPLPSGNI